MKKPVIASLVALVCLLVVSVTLCTAGSPVTVNLIGVDSSAFPRVDVRFNAWDDSGIPLTDLSTQEIYLQEDDGSEIHPETIQVNSDAQLSVVLVLDVSGSMAGQPLLDAKSAANRFLDRLGKSDQAAVIAFSSDVDTDPAKLAVGREIGFSHDLKPAYDLIEGLSAGGGTEVYNAVEKAVNMAAALPAGNRAVLLFTDGRNDPADVGNAGNAIELAEKAGVPVFAIGLGNEIDEDYLGKLTGETGGVYRSTPHSSELSELFNGMATLLKTDYTVSYTSTLQKNSGNHTLKLRLADDTREANTTWTIAHSPAAAGTTAAAVSTVEGSASAAAAAPAAPETKPGWLAENKWFYAVAVIAVIALIVILRLPRKKSAETVTKCANCGAILAGEGPCPICGSTKKMKARKE